MSFWSTLGKVATGASDVVGSLVPGYGAIANPISDFFKDQISDYEGAKATDRAYDFLRSQQEDAQTFNAEQSQLQRDFNARQQSAQNEFNASEAQKARDFTARMNDPVYQLQRQLAAGINPLAGDGMGSVSASPQASGSALGGAEAQSSALGMPSFSNPLVMAQSRLLDAQTQELRSRASLQTEKAETENLLRDGRYRYQDAIVNGVLVDNDWKEEDKKRVIQSTKNLAMEYWNLMALGDKIEAEIVSIKESSDMSRVQKKIALKRLEYFDEDKFYERLMQKQELRESKSRIRVNDSVVDLNHAKEDEAREQIKLIGQEINKFIIDNGRNSLQFEIEYEGHKVDMELVKAEKEYQLNVAKVEGSMPVVIFDKVFGYAQTVFDDVMAVKSLGVAASGNRKLLQQVTRRSGKNSATYYTYE